MYGHLVARKTFEGRMVAGVTSRLQAEQKLRFNARRARLGVKRRQITQCRARETV